MSCVKAAEPIDLLFGLWTWVGQRKHKFNRVRHMAPLCPHGRAHWCHMANTIEPSICVGDAALCQITLTTCLNFGAPIVSLEKVKLGISDMVYALILMNTNAIMIDYPSKVMCLGLQDLFKFWEITNSVSETVQHVTME